MLCFSMSPSWPDKHFLPLIAKPGSGEGSDWGSCQWPPTPEGWPWGQPLSRHVFPMCFLYPWRRGDPGGGGSRMCCQLLFYAHVNQLGCSFRTPRPAHVLQLLLISLLFILQSVNKRCNTIYERCIWPLHRVPLSCTGPLLKLLSLLFALYPPMHLHLSQHQIKTRTNVLLHTERSVNTNDGNAVIEFTDVWHWEV